MAEKPVITIPEGEPPAELLIDDEIVGEGEEAIIGKRVIVHYVGVAWSNGQEFDASWNRGDTFDFRLGAREVIEGWDRGGVATGMPEQPASVRVAGATGATLGTDPRRGR